MAKWARGVGFGDRGASVYFRFLFVFSQRDSIRLMRGFELGVATVRVPVSECTRATATLGARRPVNRGECSDLFLGWENLAAAVFYFDAA